MKKFLLPLIFALTILLPTLGNVEAADVPDIRSIAPKSIVLASKVPAEENSAAVYKYICKDGNAHRYLNQYVQILVGRGFEVIDGRQQGDDMIWGLIHTHD